MKISIIGPGIMPIPPTGWGAVEILIWDQKLALEKLGHEVDIVNTKSPIEIVQKVNAYRPDFVHIQYDDFIELYPYIQYPCAITSHFGYLEQSNKWGYYHDRIVKPFQRISPKIFCLSDGEAHPLVCMEALAAGLGVVVCEYGAANLDTTKDFITVIPESKINDIQYLEEEIIKNREYSIVHRDAIIQYALNFDWVNVIKDRYIPCVEDLISKI